jgi:low temperature requirement protein LtrA
VLGLAIMAAAVGDIHDRAKAFAIAYIAVRALSDRVWPNESGVRIAVDRPVARIGAGILPWVASLWVDGPWRYGLWALGLALDLVLTFTLSADRMAEGLSRRMAQPDRRGRRPLTTSAAHLDTAHFGERLGLFTIIVLGEGVLVVVQAMAEVPVWDRPVYATVIGSRPAPAGCCVAVWPRSAWSEPAAASRPDAAGPGRSGQCPVWCCRPWSAYSGSPRR